MTANIVFYYSKTSEMILKLGYFTSLKIESIRNAILILYNFAKFYECNGALIL